MEITFASPKEIKIVSEIKKTLSKITVTEVVDSSERKIIVAITEEVGRVKLWEGAAYDAIGQWTDTDVANRIKEIYN
jgi:hypothetical protein